MTDKSGNGGIAGYIGQLFGYLDAPWKAGVIIVLFVVGGLGWVLYENRDEIIDAWLTPSSLTLQLKTADIPQALGKLVDETTADIIQVWKIDLNNNSQRYIDGRRRDGAPVTTPTIHRLPIITISSDTKILVPMLVGSPICINLVELNGGPVIKQMIGDGMKRLCAIPISSGPQSFVGVIYLIWAKPPDTYTENVAVSAAREIASDLATR